MKKQVLYILLCLPLLVQAQILEPIHWSVAVKALSDSTSEVLLTAKIDEGWHLYTQDIPEDGPHATVFTYAQKTIGRTKTGATVHKSYDENFEMELTYYETKATFRQVIRSREGEKLSGSVEFMACNDQMCLPPSSWDWEKTAPAAPIVEENVQTPATSVEEAVADTASTDTTMLASSSAEDISAEHEVTIESAMGDEAAESHSLWWVFLMGLAAGLLAIFTPCVWPIIPMTVSFFLKRAGAAAKKAEKAAAASGDEADIKAAALLRKKADRQGLRDAILYGLAIVFIYVTLGVLVTLIFGASALNALSTNAVVNLIFFAILVVFAASFFGAFELTLPSSWSTKLDSKSSSTSGFLSILFMAFTLVIVSFSCTGPIIGTLLVEAAGKSLLAPTIGMLGFAIALALPFTLFAMFPSVLKKLPKSGGWMNTFKVTLAFLELALSLKFLSVADLAYGWHILDREVFVSLWIVIFALLGIYLLGLISFPHDDEDHRKTSVSRFFMAVISLAFAMYMVPGLWGAPLRAISAFAPPMSTQDWQAGKGATDQENTEGEIVRFDDFDKGMAYAKLHNMPVFLDFNGYGCVNCRKMEAAVLSKPMVEEHMAKYVIISLIVDDKTKLAEPIVVMENGKEKTLKTVGDKWSYLQRSEYGANAQPYYIQLSSTGERLSDSYSYDEDIQKFLQWLKY